MTRHLLSLLLFPLLLSAEESRPVLLGQVADLEQRFVIAVEALNDQQRALNESKNRVGTTDLTPLRQAVLEQLLALKEHQRRLGRVDEVEQPQADRGEDWGDRFQMAVHHSIGDSWLSDRAAETNGGEGLEQFLMFMLVNGSSFNCLPDQG